MTDRQAKQFRFETLNAVGLFCVASKEDNDSFYFYLLDGDMDENTCRSRNDVKFTKIPYNGKHLKVTIPLCAECRAKRNWPLADTSVGHYEIWRDR